VSWESLVAAALLGTERRAPEPTLPPGAPPDLAEALAAREPEDALLASAAAWAVALRAGAVPHTAQPPEPAPPDPRPACSPAAGRRLAAILAGDHPALLPEWLEAARAAGVRPAPELLPALLDAAVRRSDLRPAVAAAAGPRGRWLAARRPEWSFTAPDPEQTWAAGDRAQRRALLAALRREDPATARALLESSWDEESPEDRAAFVAALATGLDPADEPLLETALADRRKPVRRAAADVLWALPQSQLAARMAERAGPLLARRRRRIEVTLPEECDDGMERDGVERRPPRGTGERQFWLAQLLAAAPLSLWPARLKAPPGELVRLPVAGDWRTLVHGAWARAAVLQRDVEWARALRAVHPARDLLEVLPRDERENAAEDLQDALACPPPWGAALSRSVLGQIRAMVKDRLPPVDLEEVGARLHPDTLDEVPALRDAAASGWAATAVERLVNLAAFRAAMLRELP
jgi:Family of unknown function (DUF5691)